MQVSAAGTAAGVADLLNRVASPAEVADLVTAWLTQQVAVADKDNLTVACAALLHDNMA
jgi:hypothetical protein